MARNTTGLRRGGPGRPKGSKNKLTGCAKASVRSVMEELTCLHIDEIRAAFLKGINAKPPHSLRYLEVIAAYIDGKPTETIKLKGPAILPPLQVFLHPDGLETDRS